MNNEHIITKSDRAAVDEGCYWDNEAGNRAITFIHRYCWIPALGQRLTLLPWQESFIRKLYSWKQQDGTLRFKQAILSTSKKNGKNVVGTACCMYSMFSGFYMNPLVVSGSTSKDNAFDNCYMPIKYSIQRNGWLDTNEGKPLAECRDSLKEIRVKSKGTRYRVLASDKVGGSSEGLITSMVYIDELHAHYSEKLFRSLEHSTAATPNGYTLIISTAGTNFSSVWFDIISRGRKILDGSVIDTGTLFELHEATTPDDEQQWLTANPSMGTSFSLPQFKRDYQKAKTGSLADWTFFQRYRLNMWVKGHEAYIDPFKWDSCPRITPHDLHGREAVIGIDLSSSVDPSSASIVVSLGNRFYGVINHSWVCSEGAKRRTKTNLPKYELWAKAGYMTIIPGERIDHMVIRQWVESQLYNFNVREIIFDHNLAGEMEAYFTSLGKVVYHHPQNPIAFTEPTKQFDIAVSECRVKHDGNEALRWALQNTTLYVTHDGYCKPDRKNSNDKIDPCIATVMAFGRAVALDSVPTTVPSIYDTEKFELF